MRRVFLPAPPVSLPEEEKLRSPGDTSQLQEPVDKGKSYAEESSQQLRKSETLSQFWSSFGN